MIKLYGAIASPYVARVVMYAKLRGIDLPLCEVPGGNMKGPEYLKLNPIGKIPTLDVDGRGLPESSVICDYLDDAFPGTPGLPADAYDRARSRLVARFVDVYLAPQAGPLFRQLNPEKRDQKAVDTGAAEIAKAFRYIEHFMDAGPFVVGNTPTVGDCALGPYLILIRKGLCANLAEVVDPTTGDGRLARWWQAMEQHPVCKAVDDEYGTALEGFLKFMTQRR